MTTEKAALSSDVTVALEQYAIAKNGKIHRFLADPMFEKCPR